MSIRTQNIKSLLQKDNLNPGISVYWFAASDDARSFFCSECGKFVFRHQHRIIAMVEMGMDHSLLAPPIEIQCQKCGHTFIVHIM